MLSQKNQLTELIRELQSRNYIFATDPLLITEKMHNEKGSIIEKLHRRAELIDSNGKLARTLSKIDIRLKAIILFISVVSSVSGFFGLFALLQSNTVNFFYLLVCLLGFHTLMLVGWTVFTLFNYRDKPTIFASLISPSHLIRGKDDVTKASVMLYEQQLHHAGMRWYLGKISHQLWLATLTGMLVALVLLLIVRDFSFSWESTLLSANTIATMISWMGWLPDLVGFPTPTAEQVIEAQRFTNEQIGQQVGQVHNAINSYEWAMLLIGSLLMYGIIPRLIAWFVCVFMFHRKKMTLDINHPYYQKIIDFWSKRVIDIDDFEEKIVPITPTAELSSGNKLAVLFEYPHQNKHWYQQVTDADNIHHLDDFAIIDGREDIQRLIDYLDKHDFQVLVGIHSESLPDRGTMRKLSKIATHAKQGMIVKLLLDETDQRSMTDMPQLRRQQWLEALAKWSIGLL